METEDKILVNKYGQDIIADRELLERFNLLNLTQKRLYLNHILYFIMQSKPEDNDIEPAIEKSKLKQTYTPCIIIKKSVKNHNLQKLLELPANELNKTLLLLLNLFKIAYKRRFKKKK